ncbi:MAG: hypothetical protein ABII12_14350 [Planctomycetota bacterium]
MEAVVVEMSRRREIRGGDRFEVFGDGRTGVIDTASSLTDRPMAYWDGLPGKRGHLLDGHLSGMHMDNVMPDGHLCGRRISAQHLWPAEVLTFVTLPVYFGCFRFAVCTVDSSGNRSLTLSESVSCVVNSSPRRASSLAKAGFNSESRRLSFSFIPSPEL